MREELEFHGLLSKLKKGGSHLAEARDYVLWHCSGGDRFIWDTNDKVRITIRQIEEMASYIAARVILDQLPKQKGPLEE